MASELAPVLAAIATKLRAIPAMTGITVLDNEPGNLQKKITEGILRGTGIVAIVLWGKIGRPKAQSLRRVYDPVRFVVRVVENALLNKTGKHVLELAERIDAELAVEFVGGQARPWTVPLPGGQQVTVDGDMEQLSIVADLAGKPMEQPLDGWDIPFATKFSPTPAQPA